MAKLSRTFYALDGVADDYDFVLFVPGPGGGADGTSRFKAVYRNSTAFPAALAHDPLFAPISSLLGCASPRTVIAAAALAAFLPT